jgi:hypothetical protein
MATAECKMYCNSITDFKMSNTWSDFYNLTARFVSRDNLSLARAITAHNRIIT